LKKGKLGPSLVRKGGDRPSEQLPTNQERGAFYSIRRADPVLTLTEKRQQMRRENGPGMGRIIIPAKIGNHHARRWASRKRTSPHNRGKDTGRTQWVGPKRSVPGRSTGSPKSNQEAGLYDPIEGDCFLKRQTQE